VDETASVAAEGAEPPGKSRIEFRAVLPATAAAVPAMRAYARAVTGNGGPSAEAIASELASCAVRGTSPEGGVFTVTLAREPGRLRVEVATAGSGWWPMGDGEDATAHGCGLAIVAALADRFGHEGSSAGVAALWAEMGLAGGGGGQW